jgi:hypothetical protein
MCLRGVAHKLLCLAGRLSLQPDLEEFVPAL